MALERFTLRVVVVQASKDGKAEAPAAAAAPASNGSAADVDMKDAEASSSAAPEAGQYSGQLTGTPPSLPSIPSPPQIPDISFLCRCSILAPWILTMATPCNA